MLVTWFRFSLYSPHVHSSFRCHIYIVIGVATSHGLLGLFPHRFFACRTYMRLSKDLSSGSPWHPFTRKPGWCLEHVFSILGISSSQLTTTNQKLYFHWVCFRLGLTGLFTLSLCGDDIIGYTFITSILSQDLAPCEPNTGSICPARLATGNFFIEFGVSPLSAARYPLLQKHLKTTRTWAGKRNWD